MLRKFSVVMMLVTLMLLIIFPLSAFGAGGKLIINGKEITGELSPVIVGNRMLVSVRVVSEELGAAVEWNSKTRTAKITGEGKTILIPVGKRQLSVDGKTVTVDVPAQIINNRMYMPIRFLAETLGGTVGWEESTRTATIIKGKHRISDAYAALQDDRILLLVKGDSNLQYTIVEQSKDELIIDLPGAEFSEGQKTFGIDSGAIDTVNVEQISLEPAKTRVTIATHDKVPYQIDNTSEKNTLKINLLYQVNGIEQVKSGENESFVIHTDGPLEATGMQLSGPDRFVVDIPNTALNLPKVDFTFDSKIVSKVRAGQYTANPNTTRLVFDLKQNQPAKVVVDRENHTLIVIFSSKITKITSEEFDGRTRLSITATQPLGKEYKVKIENNSLIIDFPFMSWGMQSNTVELDGEIIPSVTAQSIEGGAGGIRIKGELPYYYGYQVIDSDDPNTLIIEVVNSPLVGKTIVIDPGHGGADPGALGISGSREKDHNLAIANFLGDKLRAAGANVIATRTSDVTVPLTQRPTVANNANADIFVSIHNNLAENPLPNGTETLYYTNTTDSKRLANAIHSALIEGLSSTDRGVRLRSDLHVLKATKMPAVLVEVGFISNPQEEALLISDDYREKAADSIYQGIVSFFNGGGGKR